jgi:hypothetical protein
MSHRSRRFMGFLLPDEAQLVKLLEKAILDLLKARLHRSMAGHHNDVIAQNKGRLRKAVCLPDPAANAVAYHGMAELCTGGQSQTVIAKAIFSAIYHKTASGGRLSLLVQSAEQMILF